MDTFNIRKIEGYTIMSNHHLRNKNLSYAAKGLLSFMLSLPENWDYSFNGLVAISKEGKTAVRTIINELKEAKYIKITQSRNEKGFFQYNYDVFEFPYNMPEKNRDYPTPENRVTDNRSSDNMPQINTKEEIDKSDKIDKSIFKHKTLINELIRTGFVNEHDEQLIFYDSLFEKYINNGTDYDDLYSSIHYVTNKVIARNFIDEYGKKITNKYGYFKSSMESNFKKFNTYKEQAKSKKSLWDDFEL